MLTPGRLLLAAGLLAAHLAVPSATGRYAAYTAVAVLTAYEVGRGIRLRQPRRPRGWRLLHVALWLHVGYGGTLLAQTLLPGAQRLLVLAEGAVDTVAHLFMAAAAITFLSTRRPGRDRDGLIDAAAVLVAGGLLAWQLHAERTLLTGALTADRVPLLSAVAGALLMGAAVVVGTRLYLTERPPLAFPALALGATIAFVGNVVVVVQVPQGAPPRWVELLWLLGVLLAAAAAHLPGMELLGEREAVREQRVSSGRVVALGAALLVNPALVALWGSRATSRPVLMAALVGLLTVLVLWRIGRLVTEREQMRRELGSAQAQLLHAATHDALTGLPNRALFLERAAAALVDGRQAAVVFLDLDGFKAVNDTHGHAAGDELLAVAAARLTSCLRGGDLAARLGGDEFALLVDTAEDPEVAVAIAERVLRALGEPVALSGGTVVVRASLGIARSEGPDESVATLLQRADGAMYAAKRRGKDCFQLAG